MAICHRDCRMPLLAIDVGNTQLHIGYWDAEQWATWRVHTEPARTADEYGVLFQHWLAGRTPQQIVIGSVVPRITETLRMSSQLYFDVEPLVVTSQTPMPITIDVDAPDKVGIDRLINLVGAHHQYQQRPLVVVDFGTATTFDVLSVNHVFIGGAITAGLKTTVEALAGGAANLFNIDLVVPPQPIGRNTTHALQSGLVWGYVGLVEGLLTRITQELEEMPYIVATGGLAPLVAGHIPLIGSTAPLLTLDGLRYLQLA